MISSFNLLRNVGRFDNVATGAQLPFSRVTVIYAENARGKTTLAAILRSVRSGRAELVLERARLGAQYPPHLVVGNSAGAPAVFQNGAWDQTFPDIAIFDDTFVAENVCSGIEVGPTQRQNLHELIVGAQGVALAQALQVQVDQVEIHNRALREREAAIPAHVRGSLSVDAFCALEMLPDLPRLIEEAERRVAAAQASGKVATATVFSSLSLPRIDLNALRDLFAKGLPDVEVAALARVQEHFRQLERGGEAWVAEGMGLVERLSSQGSTECPFCAQDLTVSPILAHYRVYFGEAYTALKTEIIEAAAMFRSEHAGDTPAAFERNVRESVERQAFWKEFADVPTVDLDTAAVARIWKSAREQLERLFEAKRSEPLDPIVVSPEAEQAIAEHNRQCDRIRDLSERLLATNEILEVVREEAQEGNLATLTADLSNLRAVRARHDPEYMPLCDAYLQEKQAKTVTERRRKTARNALDQHRQAAFPAYGIAINDFLQRFNASFRVGPIEPANTRGGSAANFTLLIDNHPVPLTEVTGVPSFRNTLSAGDRNTLALAFFFASLQLDPQRAQKVVVIDDPMTSLDEHRTLHTLQEVDRLAHDVARIIILSHSKPFLVEVWDKCQQLPRTALEVRRAGAGSTLVAWDVTAAMVTEHDRRYKLAKGYLQQADPAVERRVAESLRPMLESFCRVAYPVDFSPGTMLGQFHRQCLRVMGTPNEIMSTANAQELRAILDYANRFHHDSNPAYATELINDAELSDFTRRTIMFIRRP